VSDGGMTLQALGGPAIGMVLYHIASEGTSPAYLSTGGREHTHTHIPYDTLTSRAAPAPSSSRDKNHKIVVIKLHKGSFFSNSSARVKVAISCETLS
jgi:hypothetical protein